MQGDAVHDLARLTGCRERVRALNRTAARVQAARDQIASDLDARRLEVTALTRRIESLTLVGELLRALMDKLVYEQVKAVESIVTKAVVNVFFDQPLAFEAEVSQKYNKIAIDFFFRQGLEGGVIVRGSPLESFGGGPATIASLVLRLLSLLRLKRTPVLFLDESLGAVNGDDYIDSAGLFLNKLATETNVDILYVSSKPGFLDHANVAYQATSEDHADGTGAIVLRQTRGGS